MNIHFINFQLPPYTQSQTQPTTATLSINLPHHIMSSVTSTAFTTSDLRCLTSNPHINDLWEEISNLLRYTLQVRNHAVFDPIITPPNDEERLALEKVAAVVARENAQLALMMEQLENLRRQNLALMKIWNEPLYLKERTRVTTPHLTPNESSWSAPPAND